MKEQNAIPQPAREIQFPKGTDPSRACSDDETRWSLSHVLIEGGHAIATDGRMLVVQQIRDHAPDSPRLMIEGAIVRAACDPSAERYDSEGLLRLEGTTAIIDYEFSKREIHWQMRGTEDSPSFPKWARVVPPLDTRIKVGVNVKKLQELAAALGANNPRCANDPTLFLHVPLDGDQVESAIIVTAARNDNFAVLMPVRDEQPTNWTPARNPTFAWATEQAGTLKQDP